MRTTRVLVVDNNAADARGFMQALAKQGIGSVWYSGEELEMPDNRLHGIRLAVIDMNLVEVGPTDVGPTLAALNRLVDGQNGPYLAIAWTQHPEVVEEFAEKAAQLLCPPIRVIRLAKADVKNEEGAFDFAKIAAEVQEALDGSYPLGLLAFLEQMVHNSSGSIMEMVSGENGWSNGSKEALALLLKDSAGEDDPRDVKLRALLEAFNSLQFDVIETSTALLETETANLLVKPLEAVNAPPKGSDLAARLNRRLLFGVALPEVASGNIYQSEGIAAAETDTFPTLDELLDDMAQSGKKEELREAGCLAVAMEITPLCDYQQRKVKRARFICGIAVDQGKLNLFKPRDKQGDFIRSTPVVAFADKALTGKRAILWNSHYIISVSPGKISNNSALLRLRQLPLMDIQAWTGSHATRPGYLLVQ